MFTNYSKFNLYEKKKGKEEILTSSCEKQRKLIDKVVHYTRGGFDFYQKILAKE